MIYQGKTWKFGDNISTDEMMPGSTFFKTPNNSYQQQSRHCLENIRPGWTKIVKPGNIIIAGRNFGCGSSRPAPRLFQALGISAIVADSIARIFFRNCINIGLPVVNCPGVSAIFKEGEMAKINLENGKIINLSNNLSIFGESLPKNSIPDQILSAGGIDNYLKKFMMENNKILDNDLDKIYYYRDRLLKVLNGDHNLVFPLNMEIVPSLDCNLSCPHCTYRQWKNRTKNDQGHRLMSLKNMKKILDRLEEAGVQGVTFTGGGEPFINPETINGLEYAATKKFKTGIFTNGTLLTEEIIERLAKLKLNFIRISLNTAQRENYLKFHNINNPLIFEKVINNIKRFAQVLADSPTYFGIAAVINEQNVDLITSLSDLIKEILDGQPRAKIDYLTFRPVLNYGQIDPDLEKQISPLTAQRTICNYHLVQKSLAPYPVLLKFSGDYFNEASRASISFKKDYTLCLAHAWGGSIGYDGGLYLCSERDGDPDYLMGNLITQSLKKIWLSEQRRKVLNNIHDCPPACKMHRYNLLLHSLFKSKEMNDGKIDEILKKSDKIVRQSHFSFPGFLSW